MNPTARLEGPLRSARVIAIAVLAAFGLVGTARGDVVAIGALDVDGDGVLTREELVLGFGRARETAARSAERRGGGAFGPVGRSARPAAMSWDAGPPARGTGGRGRAGSAEGDRPGHARGHEIGRGRGHEPGHSRGKGHARD